MSPVAVVTGAARGIGAATVDALVAEGWQVVAVDRGADDPALDYPLATKADLEELAHRHGDRVSHSGGRRPEPVGHARRGGRSRRSLRRPAGRGGRGGYHQRGPAAVGDRRRPMGRALRRERQRRPATWPRRPSGAARRARPPAGPLGGGGVRGGPARLAPARRLQRVEARGDRADALAGRRPGRHRHHGQRRLPRLDPGRHARRVGRRLRARLARGVRGPAAGGAPPQPEEPAALIAWLCGPTRVASPARRCRSTAA